MPSLINAVRTRVLSTGSGYVAQLSTDGMMWHNLPSPMLFIGSTDSECMEDMIHFATRVALSASQLPSAGKVVWSSDAK